MFGLLRVCVVLRVSAGIFVAGTALSGIVCNYRTLCSLTGQRNGLLSPVLLATRYLLQINLHGRNTQKDKPIIQSM